jgi:hypothetical protein
MAAHPSDGMRHRPEVNTLSVSRQSAIASLLDASQIWPKIVRMQGFLPLHGVVRLTA